MTKKDKRVENMMRVTADKDVLAKGALCTRILEVAITAPLDTSDQSARPLDVAVVLDRSGSMQGEKLHYAKQAAAHLVDMLSEKDRAAVVMYDSDIDVVFPCMQMTTANREQAKTAIQRITSRGSTNLFDGWLRGCREIAEGDGADRFKRALLLSDGLANEGLTNLDEIATHVRELAARGISTSCFGIGLGYNEHLLEAMANAGGGNFHFLEAMSTIPIAFEREFDELIHTALSDAELEVQLPAGVQCTVSAGWPSTHYGGSFRTTIGSLYAERETAFYFQLQFDGNIKDEELLVPVTLRAKDTAGNEVKITQELKFAVVKPAAEADTQADAKLLERFALVDMADRATEALKMARAGRRGDASSYLAQSIQHHHASMPAENIKKYNHLSDEIMSGMNEMSYKRRHQEEYFNKKMRADVRDYRLELANGHLLALIDQQRVLIDSGIPISLGREDEWYFMQQVLPVSRSYMGVDLDAVMRLVEAPLDIIMGADILKRFCVQFDLPGKRIGFTMRPVMQGGYVFPLTELMGVPALTVDVRGKAQQAFLDTGAKLSYVTRELLEGLRAIGREEDFYPGLGKFETDVYEVAMSLGDLSFSLRCGVLPSILEATLQVAGKQAIIGTEFFRQFRTELDMGRKAISILR